MAGMRNVWFSFVFIAIGGLLFGYIIGITGNLITRGQLNCPSDWSGQMGTWTSVGLKQCYRFNEWDLGALASLNLVGATLASLFCFRFGDTLGRKREVQIAGLMYLLGATVTAAAPSLWVIYVGLLTYGLGIGFAMHAAPVYIAEITPASMRGMLVSAKEFVIVFGIFIGFAAGWAFGGLEQVGWRGMAAVAVFFAIVLEVGMCFVHRSPRWLLLQAARRRDLLGSADRFTEEARAALIFFRQAESSEEVEDEMRAIAADASTSEGPARVCDAFNYPRHLFIGCSLVFLQQVTGQPSVLYFATDILKEAGLSATAAASAMAVGLVKLVATLFTVFRVDRYGRRTLLLVGISMMMVALAMLVVGFYFRTCGQVGVSMSECPDKDLHLSRGWAILTVVALMLYVSGYQVGFGPISWLIISEIFPLGVRGAALSTAVVVNFTTNILVNSCSAVLMKVLTPSGLFLAYLALALVSLVFAYTSVPETKGKTLEEIEQEMTKVKDQASHPPRSSLWPPHLPLSQQVGCSYPEES